MGGDAHYLAAPAGGRGSAPPTTRQAADSKMPAFGAAKDHDRFVNVGVASHITAAAPGGPRYDPNLTSDERRHQSNGIWLCQTHGKLVDSDSEHFTVEKIREWKRVAEERSFHAIVA